MNKLFNGDRRHCANTKHAVLDSGGPSGVKRKMEAIDNSEAPTPKSAKIVGPTYGTVDWFKKYIPNIRKHIIEPAKAHLRYIILTSLGPTTDKPMRIAASLEAIWAVRSAWPENHDSILNLEICEHNLVDLDYVMQLYY